MLAGRLLLRFHGEETMRRIFGSICGSLAIVATFIANPPARAGEASSISTTIAEKGLAAAERDLASIEDPTPEDLFALGGVIFLRGIEKTLQTRWQHNAWMNDVPIPVLRLPVPPNPDASPFRADLVTEIFTTLDGDMERSRAALARIPEGSEVGLLVNISDLWFDVNMNGRRDVWEGLGAVAGAATGATSGATQGEPIVRFDSADVAWLSAYTHLLQGISALVRAYDPTEAIAGVMKTRTELAALRGSTPPANALEMQVGRYVDQFTMVRDALHQKPDAALVGAARLHFLAMIADNRTFWKRVGAETDNDREWIPNDSQKAALGFELPKGAGETWLRVLGDGEAILNGELLIPFWRIDPSGGVNVKKLFDNPPAVDIVAWVQGHGLLPYMERGPVADSESLRAFDQLVSGNTGFYALLFN